MLVWASLCVSEWICASMHVVLCICLFLCVFVLCVCIFICVCIYVLQRTLSKHKFPLEFSLLIPLQVQITSWPFSRLGWLLPLDIISDTLSIPSWGSLCFPHSSLFQWQSLLNITSVETNTSLPTCSLPPRWVLIGLFCSSYFPHNFFAGQK